MKILIVDDDKNISQILFIALKEEGYEVKIVNDGKEARQVISLERFDLIILDIMMPEIDGFSLCKYAREFTYAPIIFVSCLDDEQSLITALSLGGDDYVKKPFSISEVTMRVKTHLRRLEMNRRYKEGNVYRTKHFVYYPSKNLVVSNSENIHLSPLENDLLDFFFRNKNELLTYKKIYEAIWNEPYIKDKSTIMVRVSSLRNKIPYLEINSVRGKGYILENI